METVFYQKNGDEYVPAKYYDSAVLNSVPVGATLLVKQDGCTMIRQKINPDNAPLLAAMMASKESMRNAVLQAGTGSPKLPPLTKQQAKDWQNLINKHKGVFNCIQYNGLDDIIQSGLDHLQEQVKRAHETPVVKDAWDQYRFAMALSLTEQEH